MKSLVWMIALVVGLLLLPLVIAKPLTLMNGLREIFKSSACTLTFREAGDQQNIENIPAG